MKKYLFILCWITLSVNLYGQQLLVSATGVLDFNNGFTINEAGTDFQSPVISSTNLYLNVEYDNVWGYFFNPDKQWSINVQKTDIVWDKNLSVEIQRDGSGSLIFPYFSARQPLLGGTSFTEVRDNNSLFFEGAHGFSNIPVKVSLVGASVAMGAGDYSTTIYFTVYER